MGGGWRRAWSENNITPRIIEHDVEGLGVLDGMHAAFTDAGRDVAALIVVEMSSLVPLPEENIRRIVWIWMRRGKAWLSPRDSTR